MRLAWVCPISARTGVGAYAQSVLAALARMPGLEVVVLHPPCPPGDRLEMPCPTLPLSEELVASDLPQLFDLMLYHLGNNDTHHGLILRALMAHPGPVVLHDHVYQHMLAGIHHDGAAPAPGFGALVQAAAGAEGFGYLAQSGVLRASGGAVSYVPWESGWAAQVPLSDLLARLGTGVVTHSDYAARALGPDYPGDRVTLFMPRPDAPVPPPAAPPAPGARLRLAATGHIGPTKGLEMALEALGSDPALAARLRLTIAGHAGEPGWLDSLRADIAARRLEGTVRIVTDPDDAGFRAVMAEADLFLNLRFPNTEGASLSLAEQMASGRPAIVRASGAFAEMPAGTGWHLPEGGGAAALAETLRGIVRDPAQLAAKGRAAARHMGPRNAGAYAEALLEFLRRGALRMGRRAACVRARAARPGRADRDWHAAYAGARRMLADHLDGRLLLPPGLWSADAAGIGRYVALNLLDCAPAPGQDAALGRLLRAAGPLVASARIGALRQLAARASGGVGDVPHYLSDLYLPCGDRVLWRMILCLPPARAVPLALQALGQRAGPDAQARLAELAARGGLAPALCTYLETRGDPVLERPGMEAARWLLRNPQAAALEDLEPVPPGADLVALAQGAGAVPGAPGALRLDGFHAPETAGIWTAAPRARLWTRADPAQPLTALTGAAALLGEALRSEALSVTIRAVEEETGREEAWRDSRPAGGDPGLGWALPLPGFRGPLRVEFATAACHAPAALGGPPDERPLGLMLQSLRLEAGPRLIAA